MTLSLLLILSLLLGFVVAEVPVEPECRPQTHFCEDGIPDGSLPDFWPDDTISVFVLSRKREELIDSPMKATMLYSAMAFHSKITGKIYTLSWSPKSSYYDTAVPRIVSKKGLVWCNQAATCLQPGMNRSSWDSIIDVGTVTGEQFTFFELWVKRLNNTQTFQFPFLVIKGFPINIPNTWQGGFDSTHFVIGAISEMKSLEGTKFKNVSMQLNVYVIVSEKPKLLGDGETIKKKNPSLYKDIVNFYTDLQKTTEFFEKYARRLAFWWKVHFEHKFYHYLGGQYYHLKVKKPYYKVVQVPFSVYGNL